MTTSNLFYYCIHVKFIDVAQVEGALDNLEGEHVNRMTVAQLKTEFHEDSTEICFELLEEVGFQISKESLTYPEDSSKLPLLKSLYLLLDSIAG